MCPCYCRRAGRWTKELVSISDGQRRVHRVMGRCAARFKRRGMNAPVLAVGDGALGFWGALNDVSSPTHQRCWVHHVRTS